MNFPTDALDASPTQPTQPTPPPQSQRRDDPQSDRIHYTTEFHIYTKQRQNGSGVTKRARCNHCSGDWAYNETRLKHHITDPYRGCRRISTEARERVRAADAQSNQNASRAATISAAQQSPHTPLPPTKRKHEATHLSVTPSLPPTATVVPMETDLPVGYSVGPDKTGYIRVAVEFSMTSGALLRATWIASELISEFHRDIADVGLIPRMQDNTFNMYIGGKIAWSRGVGQPLPDYEHLRHIVRQQCCNASMQNAVQ